MQSDPLLQNHFEQDSNVDRPAIDEGIQSPPYFGGSQLYTTPWDKNANYSEHETLKGPIPPPKDPPSDDEGDEYITVNPNYSTLSSEKRRRVRFAQHDSETTFTNETDTDEFGRSRYDPNQFPTRPALKPRSSSSFWISQEHPLWPLSFEAPKWLPVLSLLVALVLTYIWLYVSTLAANHRTIFWARFIVGVASTIGGKLFAQSL